MSEAQMQMRLTHPPVRAQIPAREGQEGSRAGLRKRIRNFVTMSLFCLKPQLVLAIWVDKMVFVKN